MLGQLLKGLMADKKTRVGKVSPAVTTKLQANKDERIELEKELEAKIEKQIAELKAEYEPRWNELEANKMGIWEEIYNGIGLTEEERGAKYTIHNATGIVYRLEETPMFDIKDDEEKPLN